MVSIRSTYRAAPPRGLMYDGMPWDSLISGATNLIGGWISSKATKYAANKQLEAVEKTNATNLQLARDQNDWNLAQWNRENEYNTTKNQLDRWVAAGLNPNSFAATASPALAATSPQSADLANQQVPDYSMFGDAAKQFQSAILNGSDSMLRFLHYHLEQKKAEANIKHLGVQDEQIRYITDNILPEQKDMTKEQIENLKKQREVMDGDLSMLDAKINLLNAQANQADTSANSQRLQIKMFKETWDDQKMNIRLRNALLHAQIGLTKQQADNLVSELQGIILENGIKAHNFQMQDFRNWVERVVGYGQFFSTFGTSQRKEAFGALFNAIGSFFSNPFGAGDVANDRAQKWQDLLNSAPSWQNPSY